MTPLGHLVDLSPREVWSHEAHAFTPWLAENIDRLSDAVGLPLELTGTEVAVDSFAADIVARNAADGSVVLIENQLASTDHGHLGQILTYLAGLDAQTVVWIAPGFREPHRAAIRWLNEHTSGAAAFFAVRLRVVRIGDGPCAPVFEVLERPNDWERDMRTKVCPESRRHYDQKAAFWDHALARHPHLADQGFKVWRYANNYTTVNDDPATEISTYIGKSDSGIFVRSAWGEPSGPVVELLAPHAERLSDALGAPFGPTGRGDWLLSTSVPMGQQTGHDWDEIADWMSEALTLWRSEITAALANEKTPAARAAGA